MTTAIHCHQCGGMIADQAKVEYRAPRASAQLAVPHPGLCTCTPPVVYEHPPFEPEEDVPLE